MNLSGFVAPFVAAVNPMISIGLAVSVGYATAADGSQIPGYATPGALTGSIGGTFQASASGMTLTVTAALTGSLQAGDEVSGTDGVNALPPFCEVVKQLSGTPGGVGTYELDQPAAVNPCVVTSESLVLNVSAVAAGVLQVGQTLADQGALTPGTVIAGLITGVGGPGLYSINRPQTVASETMTSTVTLTAQLQPLGYRDLAQLDGINLSGQKKAIYVNGRLDGVVRPRLKGGDIISIPDGSVWLVVQILEAWSQTAGWTKAAIAIQNDVAVYPVAQSDMQPGAAP